jgi:hypothetical protein
MFMQLRLVTILLFICFFVVTFVARVIAGEIKPNQDKCVPEEGAVRIGITMPGKSWFYEWSPDGFKFTEKRKQEFSPVDVAPPGGVYYHGEWDEKAAGLPQDFLGADFRLDAPFAVSPDGRLLVTSVYPANGDLFLSKSSKLGLIDRKNQRLIRTFDAWCDVQSLTWATSGKYFAILLEQDVTKKVWKGPLDWFANFLGHPISYYTLYAALYDFQGKLLCQKRLNEKLRHGRGYLVWEEAKKANGKR